MGDGCRNRVCRTIISLKKEPFCRTLKGLWNGEYASVNYIEYYAEGVQSYFNTGNRSIQDDQTLMKGLTLYIHLYAVIWTI